MSQSVEEDVLVAVQKHRATFGMGHDTKPYAVEVIELLLRAERLSGQPDLYKHARYLLERAISESEHVSE